MVKERTRQINTIKALLTAQGAADIGDGRRGWVERLAEARTGGGGTSLTFIRRGRDLGFSIESIRTLLALAARPDLPCADADQMVARQLGEVERKIADLVLLREELRKMTNCCGEVVAECQIIGSLAAPHDS
ncbi:MAG: MerR family DNA-binding protein [Alphaproteobacteria bacterium]|nr:MerR family DNA-binding protein [Alphaproteobacteria bacterium]